MPLSTFLLIEGIKDFEDYIISEDVIGVFSSFDSAYKEYMKESVNRGKSYVYFIEEWEIDGERKNVHRY